MKRSTVIIGLVLCAVVYLLGRDVTRPSNANHSVAARPNIDQLVRASDKIPPQTSPAIPQTITQAVNKTLPSHAVQIVRLEQEYRDHPGFRQLVANFNVQTGHPGRGPIASIKALDQDAIAGAPVFGLFQAVQPRAEMARAFERHWRDERERQNQNEPVP